MDGYEPQPLIGMATILRRAFAGDDLMGLAEDLAARIADDALDMAAVLDLSIVLQIRGQHALALELGQQAILQQQHFRLARNPWSPELRVLAIMGPGEIMANTPIEFLIEHEPISLDFLYLGPGLPVPEYIPEHDIAVVCPCHSDANAELLATLDIVMQHWPRPYINPPQSIAELARESIAQRLNGLPGIQVSQTQRVSRDELVDMSTNLFSLHPWIIRPIDSHAGEGLAKLDDAESLSCYLRSTAEESFLIAPFIDYRSADGKYRKARITVIDGQPFVAHMAVSPRWMVHYLNAEMLTNAEHRREEAEFMQRFEDEFGLRHHAALATIDRSVNLEYYSIDCGETLSGDLVVFEIDSGAVVHSMDPEDIFPYKRPQMNKIFRAFRNLLESHSRKVHRAIA